MQSTPRGAVANMRLGCVVASVCPWDSVVPGSNHAPIHPPLWFSVMTKLSIGGRLNKKITHGLITKVLVTVS
jgi:hypothetical protein